MNDLITTRQAASMLGVSISLIERLIQCGALSAVTTDGRMMLSASEVHEVGPGCRQLLTSYNPTGAIKR